MSFNLRRTRDGEGESGGRSEAIEWNEDGTFKKVVDYKPTVGCSMLVGSMSARSYSVQDYWLTTTVTEILEEINSDDVHYVRFKTGNSEYEWWNGVYPK
jgi:hypothetical protein